MIDEGDSKVSRRYRELEALEPSPALDQKILIAAREANSPHAPLVAPAGRHRWYYSLAAAAVLVFAVALTLHLQSERPDPEAAGVPLRLDRELRGQIKPPPQPAQTFAPDPRAGAPAEPRAVPRAAAPRVDQALEQARVRAERAAAAAEARHADALRKEAGSSSQVGAARSLAPAPVAAPPENPERWLERIAELRSRGRHMEADRELVAFRKAYPNYQLSDLMRERVEGTPTPSR